MKTLIPLFLFLFLCFSATAQNFTTKGNTFWLAYMENLDLNFNGSPSFSVYVVSESSGQGTITAPATGLSIPFSYAANETQEVVLPPAIYYSEGSENVANLGLRIEMETEGYVFALHNRIYFSEATSLLPQEALGDSYVVTAILDTENLGSSPSSFVILATEDNTTVEITPTGLTLGLRPEGVPFSVELNAGQTYQVQSLYDLSGTLVTTTGNKKIALFGGALKARIGCGSPADSHCYDQLLPVDAAAKAYPLIPYGGHSFSLVKITATENNTEVFLNQSSIATLNKGEFLETEINDPKMLEATEPVFVVQLNPSQECSPGSIGDPNMLHLAPLEMRGKYLPFEHLNIFIGEGPEAPRYFVTLFTETEYVAEVRVNGNTVADEFEWFPGNEAYSYAIIELNAGKHLVESSRGVLAYAYAFGDYDAYTYHLGYEAPVATTATTTLLSGTLSVSPNPANDYLSLKNNSVERIESVELINGVGKRVRDVFSIAGQAVFQLEVKEIPAGIYCLRYKENDQWFVEKVVIQ